MLLVHYGLLITFLNLNALLISDVIDASIQNNALMRSPIFKVYSPPPSALGADGPLEARMFPKPAPDAENKNAIRVPDKQCIVRYII